MLGCPLCSILLGATANFTNHHDGLSGIIVFKCFKGFLQRGANNGIAASAQACGEADVGQLPHQLIGKSAGLGHQSQRSTGDDAVRNDAEIATLRTFHRRKRKQARTVRPDDAYALAQCELNKIRTVGNRNAFGDNHNQLDTGFNGLDHGILSKTRRDEHNTCLRTGSFNSFGTATKNT